MLKAAMEAGVYIQASCGGEGVCGKCKVRIEQGEVESTRGAKISEEEFRRGVTATLVQTRMESQLGEYQRRGWLLQPALPARPLKAEESSTECALLWAQSRIFASTP